MKISAHEITSWVSRNLNTNLKPVIVDEVGKLLLTSTYVCYSVVQDYSYTQELFMHGVSMDQCEGRNAFRRGQLPLWKQNVTLRCYLYCKDLIHTGPRIN